MNGFAYKNGMCRYDDANCQIVMGNKCSLCLDGYIYYEVSGKCVSKTEIDANNKKN